MIRLIVQYTDLHIGAPHQIVENTEKIKEEFLKYEDDPEVLVICTGDIVDNKNVEKSKVKKYASMRDELKELMGKYYIFGNHETEAAPFYEIHEDVIWMHYHVKDWCNAFEKKCEKVIKWETKKEGMNAWKYFFYRFKHLVISKGKIWHPSDKDVLDLVKYAKKHKCKAILTGHKHKMYDRVHDGVRVINGGRGRTEYIF